MRIAIEGMPGAGKTAVLHGIRVPPDVPKIDFVTDAALAEKFRDDPGEYALTYALDVLLHFDAAPSSCVIVGSPASARHVYANHFHNAGYLSDPAFDLYKAYHARLGWTPDFVLFVRPLVDPADIDQDPKLEFQFKTYAAFLNCTVVRTVEDAQRALDDFFGCNK